MTTKFTESTVEEAVLEWTDGLAYAVLNGPEIAPGEPAAERESFGDVLLVGRLRDAIEQINIEYSIGLGMYRCDKRSPIRPRTRVQATILKRTLLPLNHAPGVPAVGISIAVEKQIRLVKATLAPGGCG